MNISTFGIGGDLAVLSGAEALPAGLRRVAQNLSRASPSTVVLWWWVVFFMNECIETSPGSASHSFPVQTGCKGRVVGENEFLNI